MFAEMYSRGHYAGGTGWPRSLASANLFQYTKHPGPPGLG